MAGAQKKYINTDLLSRNFSTFLLITIKKVGRLLIAILTCRNGKSLCDLAIMPDNL